MKSLYMERVNENSLRIKLLDYENITFKTIKEKEELRVVALPGQTDEAGKVVSDT